MSYKVTAIQLQAIVPKINGERAKELADLINQVCPRYGIDTPLRLAAFLAQCAHESDGFTARSENLNYSVDGLKKTFSYYRANPGLAAMHGRSGGHPANQEAIANTVYDDVNRSNNRKLGNTFSGDGWQFRGSGWIQLTGRELITEYARYVKQPVRDAAANMRTTDLWALDSACWVFAVKKNLLDEADKGQIDAISRAINGGDSGLLERRDLYKRAKKALGI